MDDKLLIALVTAGATIVALILGAIGWCVKVWVDHLRAKREMLQNVPSRTLALLHKPNKASVWQYRTDYGRIQVNLSITFLVTNITKLPISLANARVKVLGKTHLTAVQVKIRDGREVDENSPLTYYGDHNVPPGETYSGLITVILEHPIEPEQEVPVSVVIRDQYGIPHKISTSCVQRNPHTSSKEDSLPQVSKKEDGQLVEVKGRFPSRRRFRGAVSITGKGITVGICQVRFSNKHIMPCIPLIRKEGLSQQGHWAVDAKSQAEVVFDAPVRGKPTEFTTDIILIDTYGRQLVVPGVRINM